MRRRRYRMYLFRRILITPRTFCVVVLSLISMAGMLRAEEPDPRLTPLVKAVRRCQASVVNIHTEKDGAE
ncbi:MAG: hypothetical protein KDA89_09225, partial [Planctomycetaceae bacterium]|nr:hypothetical protein [Planctomycetaceae bacterium]